MAELLTGNPEAMRSIAGYTTKTPCGLFYFSPCSFNNFQDWYATLRARTSLLTRNWTKLLEVADKEKKPLTDDESKYESQIKNIKDFILELKGVPQNLHRDSYYQYIAQIQTNLADANSLIENIQIAIEERDGRYITFIGDPSYITTGTQRNISWAKFFLISAGVLGGVWAYKNYRSDKKVALLPTPS